MSSAIPLLVALIAFVVMEPVTSLSHRLVFHGPGTVLHRSHHRPNSRGWEANDLFPVVFAGATITVMAVGALRPELSILIAIGAGVTAYGASYLVVHDLYIHRRLAVLPKRVEWLEPLREAHRIHHLYNAAPYGMLVPVVPAELRRRAATTGRDPIRSAGPCRAESPAALSAGTAPSGEATPSTV